MTEEDYIELCAENAREDARYNLQRKNFIRPYEEVLDHFAPNNMTREEFDALCEVMSSPVKPICDNRKNGNSQLEYAAPHCWVARNKKGTLTLFEQIPRRCENHWWDRDYQSCELEPDYFPDLKWEDEPIEVELIIRAI